MLIQIRQMKMAEHPYRSLLRREKKVYSSYFWNGGMSIQIHQMEMAEHPYRSLLRRDVKV